MISKIPIDTDKKIIERYEKRADFTVYKYWIMRSSERPVIIAVYHLRFHL